MRLAWGLTARLTPERASALGARIVGAIGPHTRKHRMVLANLAVVFPDRTAAGIERLARDSWAHFGRVIAEFPHFERFCEPAEPPRVEIVDRHGVLAAAAAGRPAILASGHFGNWELLAGLAGRHGMPLTVVHAARANPRIERLVEQRRRALGCEFIEQGESAHRMLAAIRRGRSIGVLVDQRYDAGELVELCGRPASAPIGPALLATRLRLPFVPVRCERIGPAASGSPSSHPSPRAPASSSRATRRKI
ncbi:MAG: hypothetical protein R3D25_17830 [Geminicoccaceae bacterium]